MIIINLAILKCYQLVTCFTFSNDVEMAIEILYYLDWKSLSRASRVCKLWYEECKRDKVWERLCLQMFPTIMEDPLLQYIRAKKSWQWIVRCKVVSCRIL